MKHALLLVFFVVSTVVCVAEDLEKNEVPGTVFPTVQFSSHPNPKPPKTTTPKPTTTTTPKPTTTTTPKPTTTTTPKPTTTTTPKPTTTTTPKPTTTTTPKPTTTTTPKPTTTTTPKPTTTTTPKPTTTTTPKPTTTTTPKTTTTAPKTTTTTTPKTTTTAPKTTTTTAKPVPPKPTPPATLIVGTYSTKKDKITCLLARMALQIRVVSAKVNGTFIVQPNQTASHGVCEKTTTLNISFVEGFINFGFNKNSTGNSVYLDELSLSLFYTFNTTEEKYAQQNKSLHLFAARIGHAYSCKSESIYMGNGIYLDVTQNQIQAFNFTKDGDFDISDGCSADAPNYSVAIVVGVILLVLIIIVVVAYILGRRRRSGGYQPL